jgi:adenosylcobinamide-GDP ribazoletransferase
VTVIPALEAFRFLSIIPVPGRTVADDRLARAAAFFPLVGAALGGLLVLIDWAVDKAFPSAYHAMAAALVIAAYALFTRGLHHDGLMDTADAFLGARSREERLRIMKDSRTGAFGVTSLVVLLLVESAAIFSLPEHVSNAGGNLRWAALLSVPVLGRWAMSYMCARFPYARDEGTGSAMVVNAGWRELTIASVIAFTAISCSFVFIVKDPWLIAPLLLLSFGIAETAGRYFTRSIGGVTGDTVGATAMVVECILLVVLASRLPELL